MHVQCTLPSWMVLEVDNQANCFSTLQTNSGVWTNIWWGRQYRLEEKCSQWQVWHIGRTRQLQPHRQGPHCTNPDRSCSREMAVDLSCRKRGSYQYLPSSTTLRRSMDYCNSDFLESINLYSMGGGCAMRFTVQAHKSLFTIKRNQDLRN